MKTCRKCNEEKQLTDFFKKKKSTDGYDNLCKKCASTYWIKQKEHIEDGYKKCAKCGNIKKNENFSKRSNTKSGLRSTCKECDKIFREENIDNFKKYRKIYSEKNKDSIKETCKNWEINNKEKRKEQKIRYKNKNKHIFAWKNILRSSLRRMNTKKSNHTIDLLGYSSLELKEYISSLFTNGMSWENYGEWHIDHIKPVSSFDKETPVNVVCSLNNLQPLWSTTRIIDGVVYEGNLNKSNKI